MLTYTAPRCNRHRVRPLERAPGRMAPSATRTLRGTGLQKVHRKPARKIYTRTDRDRDKARDDRKFRLQVCSGSTRCGEKEYFQRCSQRSNLSTGKAAPCCSLCLFNLKPYCSFTAHSRFQLLPHRRMPRMPSARIHRRHL